MLLWANKNDLSLSSGQDVSSRVHSLTDKLTSLKDNIFCNESDKLWAHLINLRSKNSTENINIDIVLDNCSIELASDLILCDFLLSNSFVSRITLHAKAYSWFISDVTKFEFDYLLKQIQKSNSIISNNFLKRIKTYIKEEKIKLEYDNLFWTSPYSYDQMEAIDPLLYKNFEENSSLVILKGDLNYRKLIGDLDWPFDIELKLAARNFHPTSVCAIRCIKADLIAGFDFQNENFLKLDKDLKESKKWMITGDYGIIQFF